MSQTHDLILTDQEWQQFVAIMEAPIKMNENLTQAIHAFYKKIQ